MDGDTFRSRVIKLVQKSRKALRLYESMLKSRSENNPEFSDLQAQAWCAVTSDLLRQLTLAIDSPNQKKFTADIFALRDRFQSEWRSGETELKQNQKELIKSSENGDFARAASISKGLVSLKARVQASQAAHHELNEVINRSKVTEPTIELSSDDIIAENSVFLLNGPFGAPFSDFRKHNSDTPAISYSESFTESFTAESDTDQAAQSTKRTFGKVIPMRTARR